MVQQPRSEEYLAIVPLNRRFFEWGDTEPPDPDFRLAMGLGDAGVGWEELLTKRRVVILAEAGSGKSREMAERARLITASGRYAFHATVEDVGRDGLEAALGHVDRTRFAEWRASAEPAWFFIDSVDEGKLHAIRLETVARKLANGIHGAEERAHLVLSGRVTDWEFRKDLESLKDRLPLSVPASMPDATPEEELRRALRQDSRPEQPPSPEQPFAVLMAPLDRDRVRLFAQGKAVPNLDQFLEQIDAANLRHFARRPLDLDWLVKFWQSEGRIGSLAEMIERSVTERLKETNTDRARIDALDSDRALRAVERVGAAMVFGRKATIAIPDGEVAFTADSSIDLADVLPDWSAEDRILLLSRPLFDPATLGRARFHNDNEGVVRGYLTARWLMRLRHANLATASLFELLFAKSYGLEVVKPSLAETVAWLALWDGDVAREVVRRSPLLLLGSGDPASLPHDIRRNALVSSLKGLTTDDDDEGARWDNEGVRRFARPDMGSVVLSLWPDCRSNWKGARLLQQMVWLGALKDCARLATEATFDPRLDPVTRVFAGRALLAMGDEKAKRDYAQLVMAELPTLPSNMVRDAIAELFPTFIGVPNLLIILGSIDIADDRDGIGFRWEGPQLVDKLDARSDLEELLGGLLTQLGGDLGERAYHPPTTREEAYFPAIAAAALRLLKVCPPDIAPEPAIDAIVRVGYRRNHASEQQAILNEALTELHRTSSRRRAAFWRVTEKYRHPSRGPQKIASTWQMEVLSGYKAGLQGEDAEWLLNDGLTKEEDDRRLAINAALSLQSSTGAPTDLLVRIDSATRSDPVAFDAHDAWAQSQQPPVGQLERERELQEMENENVSARAKNDQTWVDFVRDVRADPARIARLSSPGSPGVNSDLFGLWRLLDRASGRSRYAIDGVAPLAKIAGADVAAAVRAALIAHWRKTAPVLRSKKSSQNRSSLSEVDVMGIAGVSLEAASGECWAAQLTAHEATLAAGYATLELNGFPRWLSALKAARPGEVRAVLIGEIFDELSRPELQHCETLSNTAHADETFAALVAPALLDDLEMRGPLPLGALSHVLHIIVRGIQPESEPRFTRLGIQRFEKECDVSAAMQYLAAVFSLDAVTATNAVAEKLVEMSIPEREQLMDRFLSSTFGGSISGSPFKARDVPGDTLEQLVDLSFRTNGQAATRMRPAGVVYQPNQNDHAYQARSTVFYRFAKTPGAATFHALLRLQNHPDCPIPPAKLRSIAEDRAIEDSESAPWEPSEAFTFEQAHETAPRTPRDLQSTLVCRLEDIQHDLVHGDFAQGTALKALPDETAVQNWVATRLRLKQGRSFSVEREPHVADEKEPDVRVRAKATDASVAMEIKVIDSWTLKQLEEALEVQLCGRYLRAKDGRHGVLLLVHQKARKNGWKDMNNRVFLPFSKVVARLSARAAVIAGANHDAPQPEVCVLDVSGCSARA